jgi:hypothetical protein
VHLLQKWKGLAFSLLLHSKTTKSHFSMKTKSSLFSMNNMQRKTQLPPPLLSSINNEEHLIYPDRVLRNLKPLFASFLKGLTRNRRKVTEKESLQTQKYCPTPTREHMQYWKDTLLTNVNTYRSRSKLTSCRDTFLEVLYVFKVIAEMIVVRWCHINDMVSVHTGRSHYSF